MSDAKPNDDLTRYADRLDRVLAEIEGAAVALADLKVEIKSAGFDATALVAVAKLKRDDAKRKRTEERLQQMTLYASRLGVQMELGV